MLPVTNALVAAMLVLGVDPPARVAVSPPINAARVQILSTMVSDDYVGEWGFAALVEANGQQILFDTGARPDTVAQNAKARGLDLDADDARVDWTAGEFKRLGVAHLVGAHCTGIEATMRLRHGSGLDRKTAVVGAVGASFDLETGIDPGDLAR